jgi:hypothetical protein
METTKKNFQIEELENRLEMATIQGISPTTTAVEGNNGCKTNKSCTNSGW